MYLGHGGKFYKPGPLKHQQITLKYRTLDDKALMDLKTFAQEHRCRSSFAEAQRESMAEMWGSSMGGLLDDEGSTPHNITVQFCKCTNVPGGSNPASTLWWDGFSIAKNISDEDAEATFIALVNGVSAEMVRENNDKAVWLMDAYVPGKSAEGVSMVASAG